MQIELYTAEQLILVPVLLRFKLLLQNWKSINRQVVIKFRQNWSKQEVTYYFLINCVWNKEKLPDYLEESIIVPIHKKGDNTGCNNCRGMSQLSTLCKIVSKSSSQGQKK
jgi:hypothetical protein